MTREVNKVTEEIIGAAIAVHRELGPGLLESTYEACLAYELSQRGLSFEQQKALPVRYGKARLCLVIPRSYAVGRARLPPSRSARVCTAQQELRPPRTACEIRGGWSMTLRSDCLCGDPQSVRKGEEQ